MIMQKFDLKEVIAFISEQTPETKIYLGCDSERFKIKGQWFADYILAVVIHKNGNNGCKIFGRVDRERDFDQKAARPINRLMTEVYKVAELYMQLEEAIQDREIEIHLDINPNELHGSSCALTQAIGYIRGTCNVVPLVKPNAFAASYAADRLKTLHAA